MKRILLMIVAVLFFAGCSASRSDFSEPIAAETEFQSFWLSEQGTPWDREGTLVEIPLRIPGNLQLSNMLNFDGNLLIWSIDDHLQDQTELELCLISLADGSILAQRDVHIGGYVVPQVLEGYLYICDNYGGQILQLDKSLQDVFTWKLQSNEYSWYYGADGIVYQMADYSRLRAHHLTDGQVYPVLEGDPVVNFSGVVGSSISLEYYHPDTGSPTYAVLDLSTGNVIQPERAARYGYISIAGDAWLSSRSTVPFAYRYCSGEAVPVALHTDGYYAELLEEEKLLLTSEDSTYLHLYEWNGTPVSFCRISETGGCMVSDMIWNEEQGGYYILLSTFDGNGRLLFWDISQPPLLDNLHFEEILAPSDEEAALLRRCEEIGTEYGVSIRIGEACDTEFFNFIAALETDWTQVAEELDVLEAVLGDYPEGFFRQLRRKSPQGIQIQLVQDLQPYEGSEYTDEYAAFVEYRWDCDVMVVDIERSDSTTYYHEFSHVIDSFLEWDSWEREEALFSEASWNTLNPDWFEGYTLNYSQEANIDEYGFFVDYYSTISPTEDRARIMEYAMAEYGVWTFEDAHGLQNKLDYYSRCIRDAFDTTGWPATTLWEQYLNIGVG